MRDRKAQKKGVFTSGPANPPPGSYSTTRGLFASRTKSHAPSGPRYGAYPLRSAIYSAAAVCEGLLSIAELRPCSKVLPDSCQPNPGAVTAGELGRWSRGHPLVRFVIGRDADAEHFRDAGVSLCNRFADLSLRHAANVRVVPCHLG